jgi:hypothetical protein
MAALMEINKFFTIKKEGMGDPDVYLGCKLRKHTLPNGQEAWIQSPSKYIEEAVRKAGDYFESAYSMTYPKKDTSPFTPDYRPEMDITEPLNAKKVTFYQSQIGILRWIVEIGRVDIITEVSLLASQMALPREGHLMQVFRIFAFLRNRHNGCLVFDPTRPNLKMSSFNNGAEWKDFYGTVEEPIPGNAPPPTGKDVILRLFVDSDHAGERMTRRSRTGYLIYMNLAPILWFSKRQGTVETSVFGAEFVAMRAGNEACTRGIRYKLRMMGIPINDPTYIYGDNMSVIYNTQRPESTLKKKSSSICYHYMRESVAMGESLTAHIRSEDNPADICTKVIPGGVKRDCLTNMILHFASNISLIGIKRNRKRRKLTPQKETGL